MKPQYTNKKHTVIFDDHVAKNYEKDFKKKYKGLWEETKKSIKETLERIPNLYGLETLTPICKSNKETYLLKFDFKIAKSKISPKSSGNRCILDVCTRSCCVKIILIYCKHHIDKPKGQETLWWKEKIKNRFGISCAS